MPSLPLSASRTIVVRTTVFVPKVKRLILLKTRQRAQLPTIAPSLLSFFVCLSPIALALWRVEPG